MKRLLLSMISLITLSPILVHAATPSKFDVVVNNGQPMKTSEYADVVVKALDSNGNVVTTTKSDIWLEVKGHDYSDPDIVLPGNGIGFFEASDLGVKTFSKGLSIKKPGTYELTIVDVYDTNLKGTATIQVLSDTAGPAVGGLTVTSPASGTVEKQSNVAVIGKTSYANTPIVIMIDGVKTQETITDQKGDFSLQLAGIQPGQHTLVVNALDLADKIVATSGPIPFTYQPDAKKLFLGLEILPSKEVVVRTKMTFTVKTDESVASALLKFGSMDPVPTTKQSPGIFVTTMTFDTPASYPIDVILNVNQQNTTFDKVETITITDELRKITSLSSTPNASLNTAELLWTFVGKIDFFKVKYGTTKSNLRLSVTSTKPSTALLLAEPTLTYYAQVFPVDEKGETNGEPSEIITIDPIQAKNAICGNAIIEPGETCDDGNLRTDDGCSAQCQIEIAPTPLPTLPAASTGTDHNGAPEATATTKNSCFPGGLEIKAVKIGEQYYITWPSVNNAKEYQIYRSEGPVQTIDQMLMIGNTNDTKYAYPFDAEAKVEKYAYYAVRAVCDNDDIKPVGDMTKVKVGPEKTLLLLMMASLFIFGMVRIIKSST